MDAWTVLEAWPRQRLKPRRFLISQDETLTMSIFFGKSFILRLKFSPPFLAAGSLSCRFMWARVLPPAQSLLSQLLFYFLIPRTLSVCLSVCICLSPSLSLLLCPSVSLSLSLFVCLSLSLSLWFFFLSLPKKMISLVYRSTPLYLWTLKQQTYTNFTCLKFEKYGFRCQINTLSNQHSSYYSLELKSDHVAPKLIALTCSAAYGHLFPGAQFMLPDTCIPSLNNLTQTPGYTANVCIPLSAFQCLHI